MKSGGQNTVAYYHAYRYSLHSTSINKRMLKMNGVRRVIIFCLLTAVLPTILIIIPLYLRHKVFSDTVYVVAESDILEIGEDISTIFCQDHTLKMNTTFSAYQVDSKPEISNTRKHIRLKKSMRLPDDTLEYWGFFLPKGSTVRLSVCSRYDGSRILVVRGEKNLRTCGLLNRSKGKETHSTTPANPSQGQVRVRFELNVDDYVLESPEPNNFTKVRSVETTPRYTHLASQLDKNTAEEDQSDDLKLPMDKEAGIDQEFRTYEETVVGRRLRHSRSHDERKEKVQRSRHPRGTQPLQPHNLDAKVLHGGNAGKNVESEESSASSFETELLSCYGGDILLTQGFPPSNLCVNASFLLSNYTNRMTTTHNVNDDGYYYYIFYSDNDLVENDIHTIFDIYKPTYQMANITKRCINQTMCSFPVALLSSEVVIVEVPTRDGIEHEEEDISMLVSVCHPRMAVYIIFPLLVLILILGCAFL